MPRKARFDQQRLTGLLRRQHLVIRRRQALACGLTEIALQYRIQTGGPWQRLLPGVYLTTIGPVLPEQREIAALLYAGPRSVLTGMAALRRNGFRVPAPNVVDVLVPADFKRQSMGFVRVQRSTRMPPEVCVTGEVRFVLPARAVADAARRMRSARDVRALVAKAIQEQWCSIPQLDTELEQGPMAGSALLRAALAEVRGGVRSAPEGDLRVLIQHNKIPLPVFNARVYDGTTLSRWWMRGGRRRGSSRRWTHGSITIRRRTGSGRCGGMTGWWPMESCCCTSRRGRSGPRPMRWSRRFAPPWPAGSSDHG